MKYELSVTINIGNYQSIKLGGSEADSFEEIETAILKQIADYEKNTGEQIGREIKKMIK